jgi:nitrate/nitrite-specific signal transduction histidine kinase
MVTHIASSPIRSIASYRRKALHTAIAQVLSPAQLTMVRELVSAEDPEHAEPVVDDILYWMRLNMPNAAIQVEEVLHPYRLAD